MTVAELGERMSSHEFSEWMAFYDIEPFGDEWRQSGQIVSAIANSNRKKGARPFKIEDFMPIAPEQPKAVEPDDADDTAEAVRPDPVDLMSKFRGATGFKG